MQVNTGYKTDYYAGYKPESETAKEKADAFDGCIADAGKKADDSTSTNIRDMSDKEWDKLMEHVDKFIEDFKEAVRYEEEVNIKNKEKSEETAKNLVEKLVAKEKDAKELTKEQELALTGSTDTGISKTDGVTECAAADMDEDKDVVWTVTAFTEDGIICTKCKNGKSVELWRMSYKHVGDYKKVTDFLDSFDENTDWSFTASKSFWEDFLDGRVSDEDIKKLRQEAKLSD